MKKTAKQIQGDIIELLKGSDLTAALTGDVYRGDGDKSYRPRDSRLEDTIVIFTSGLNDEDVETGVVTLNIFVADIDPYQDGTMVENGARTAEIEELAQAWVESQTAAKSNYLFELQQTIATYAATTTDEHYVSVALKYRLFQ